MPPTEIEKHRQGPEFEQRAKLAKLRHKLRTPLNAIIGYSEMLIEDAQQSGLKRLTDDLDRIRSAGQEILVAINDIFKLSETRSGPLEVEVSGLGAKLNYSLRTPLNAVIGYCEMLLEDCPETNLGDLDTDLRRIHSAAQQFLGDIQRMGNISDVMAREIDTTLGIDFKESSIKDLVAGLSRFKGVEETSQQVSDARLLVVDDSKMTRELLSRMLERQGHAVTTAENGTAALEELSTQSVDLVLLDVLMPEMNGYQVLKQIKTDPRSRDIPVIMVSALEELESVVQSIELGAEDYLLKPINAVLLAARVKNCLEQKRLRDLEREQSLVCSETFGIYVDQDVRDAILSGTIPLDGELRDVSVLFADLRDFTALAESLPPKAVVRLLNGYFAQMAPIIHHHRGSILQYVGDEIYAVFGAPLPLKNHPGQALKAALDMRSRLRVLNKNLKKNGHAPLDHGIGIHSGQAVAANIGVSNRMSYNLVGDTVNLASRIQRLTRRYNTDIIVSAATRNRIRDDVALDKIALATVKGRETPVEIFKVAKGR